MSQVETEANKGDGKKKIQQGSRRKVKSDITDMKEGQQFKKEAVLGSHDHPLVNCWKDS